MIAISIVLGLSVGFLQAHILKALYATILAKNKLNWWLLGIKFFIYAAFFVYCLLLDPKHFLLSASLMVVCFFVFTLVYFLQQSRTKSKKQHIHKEKKAQKDNEITSEDTDK